MRDVAGTEDRTRLHLASGLLALAAVTVGVVAAGGWDSDLHILYLAVLVHGALALDARWVLLEGVLILLVALGWPVYGDVSGAGQLVGAVSEVAVWLGAALVVVRVRAHQWEIAERLRRNEARYRSLFAHHPDSVHARDPAGGVVDQNHAAAEMIGVEADELARRPWTDFVPEERRAELERHYVGALRGEPRSFETQFLHAEGHRIDVAVTFIPIVVDGSVTGVYQITQDITQRRRAESELELYRRVLDQISDAVVIGDPGSERFLYANPAAAELYRVPLTRIIGASPGELSPTWAGHRLEERIGELRRSPGEGIRAEFDLERPDGTSVPVESVGQLVEAPDGRSVLVGVLRDVSERRRAEAARRQLAAIVESAEHAIVGSDLDGIVTSWNPGAERLYGYAAEEMIGRSIRELVPDGSARQGPEAFLARVSEGETVQSEVVRRRKDGGLVEVALTVSPILDGLGRVVAVSAISTDIAPRKAAERALRRSERRFRTLAERGQGIVYLLNLEPEPRFEFVNAVVEEVTGFAPEAFYADPMLPLARAHPEDLDVVRSTRSPQEPGSVTARFRHRDGHWVWLEDRFTPIVDDEGRVTAVQGVMFDVSARQEAEQALEAALRAEHESAERLRAVNEMQTAFLQAVSHELRTPLTSVAGYAQTLRDHWSDLPDEHVTHMLGRLHLNAERLAEMLQDLLDVDRLSRGTVQLSVTEVELGQLCRHVVDQIELHDHPVRVDAQGAVEIRADGPKVERIVENLVYNAGKHTPPGTPIWVRVEPVDEGGLLTVEDEGPGIPVALREQIFEPFRQGPEAASAPSPGTGIGLALVARFSQLHGGRVWVEDGPGGGAAFRVLLPHEPPDDALVGSTVEASSD